MNTYGAGGTAGRAAARVPVKRLDGRDVAGQAGYVASLFGIAA